jgi:hypothetical protein
LRKLLAELTKGRSKKIQIHKIRDENEESQETAMKFREC